MMRFGELVKALREAHHLTQDDLAALMGLSRSGRVTIAYWETGQRTPNAEQLRKLGACLGYWPITGNSTLRREIVQRALTAAFDETYEPTAIPTSGMHTKARRVNAVALNAQPQT